MRSIETSATNIFLEPMQEASYENNTQFLDDTIDRFEGNDPNNLYKAEVDLLKVDVETYSNAVVKAGRGSQKFATDAVKEAIAKILETGGRLYIDLQKGFGKKSPVLMIFFSKGLTGLARAKRGDYKNIIKDWLGKVTKTPYVEKLGKPWEEELIELQSTWATASGEQSVAKEDVGIGQTDADLLLIPIANRLWKLYLMVVLNNLPNGENVVKNYFDTTPVNPKDNHDKDGLGRTFGTAKDGAGVGLPNVEITAKDANQQIIWKGKTDGEGKWRTKNMGVGMYHFTFEKPGLATQTLSHEVLDDRDTDLDVVMLPA